MFTPVPVHDVLAVLFPGSVTWLLLTSPEWDKAVTVRCTRPEGLDACPKHDTDATNPKNIELRPRASKVLIFTENPFGLNDTILRQGCECFKGTSILLG